MAGQIGVAVIGAGMAGRAHLRGTARLRRCSTHRCRPLRYVAVVDANEAVAKDAAAALRLRARRHRLARAARRRRRPGGQRRRRQPPAPRDRRGACSPPGKHVLCEKPLARQPRRRARHDRGGRGPPRAGHRHRLRLPSPAGGRRHPRPAPAASSARCRTSTGATGATTPAAPRRPMAWRYKGGPGTGALPTSAATSSTSRSSSAVRCSSVSGATFTTKVTERAVPHRHHLRPRQGRAQRRLRAGRERRRRRPSPRSFASGAIGTFSVSRIATGHANSLGFEVLAERRRRALGHGPPRRVLGRPPAARRRARRLQPGARRAGAPLRQGRAADGLPRCLVRRRRPVRLPGPGLHRAGGRHRGGYHRWPPSTDGVRDLTVVDAVIRSAAAGGSSVDVVH